ncbi:9193_t:CDS:2 [Racocetra fulgida]|uniref:9193_t:CDS:1 n=1 Tax=Racocetra fulgida TaxID=60492 RepID=A0A9N8ZPR7_9GLOM|nr:9193_t:CDS:2 [Racocetra fulgida]
MSYKQIIEHIIGFYPNFLNNPVINDIEEIAHLVPNPLKIINDRAILALNVEHIARNEVRINDKGAIRMATTYFLSLLQHRQNLIPYMSELHLIFLCLIQISMGTIV